MANYLTDKFGGEVDAWNPLPTNDVSVSYDNIAVTGESMTFVTGAAGFSQIVATDKAPIMNLVGDRVGSFWRNPKNLRLTNQGNFSRSDVTTVVETATSATVTIVDRDNNLEQLFESPVATGKYVLVVKDATAGVLYGWIGAVAATGDSYVLDIYNDAALGTQSWVGTLGNFAVDSGTVFEIFSNETSISWTTGTVLTTEIEWAEAVPETQQLTKMANGEYAVDYEHGRLMYKKATTGTSDTIAYTTRAATMVTVTTSGVPAPIYAEDSVHVSGDSGTPALAVRNDSLAALGGTDGDYAPMQVDANGALYTLDSNSTNMLTALQLLDNVVIVDDAAFAVGSTSLNAVGFLADETTPDSVDEGDLGAARITLDRKQITASEFVEDTAHATADYGTHVLAVRNDGLAALATTDGDYAPLQVSDVGALYTDVSEFAGNAITLAAGAVAAGTLRVTLGSDDPAVASLAIMDDWDETNRAAVNVISGQAGIAAGAGAVGVTVPRVTLASDDPGVALLTTIDSDTNDIKTAVELLDNSVAVLGTATYTEASSSGLVVGAVRNDTLAALADTDNEIAPFQVDASGALYVLDSNSTAILSDTTAILADTAAIQTAVEVLDNTVLVDDAAFGVATTSVSMIGFLADETTPDSVNEGDVGAARITLDRKQITASEHLEDVAHSSGDYGTFVMGVRNDDLAALGGTDGDYTPLQVDAAGALFVANAITGIGDGVTTVTTAGTDVVLGGDVSCKRVIIMAQTDNTNEIAVGATGVDATIATGTGIILDAGEAIDIEIDNLNRVYIDSITNGEGVRYTYFT